MTYLGRMWRIGAVTQIWKNLGNKSHLLQECPYHSSVGCSYPTAYHPFLGATVVPSSPWDLPSLWLLTAPQSPVTFLWTWSCLCESPASRVGVAGSLSKFYRDRAYFTRDNRDTNTDRVRRWLLVCESWSLKTQEESLVPLHSSSCYGLDTEPGMWM